MCGQGCVCFVNTLAFQLHLVHQWVLGEGCAGMVRCGCQHAVCVKISCTLFFAAS